MSRLFAVALLLTSTFPLGLAAQAQQEGPVPTQVLVGVDAKSMQPASSSDLTVTVNDRKEPLTAWAPVVPANAQVALLIDDGLRESVGRELDNLRAFVRNLAPGVEILVGFMQYGHVAAEQPFTTDHAQAASTLHLPEGLPGMSASPYVCLSDFVKHWPGSGSSASSVAGVGASTRTRARFAIMITNGVDPYNGGTSVMNQGSPYVDTAIADAQRAGVAVYAIYYSDAGIAAFRRTIVARTTSRNSPRRLAASATGKASAIQSPPRRSWPSSSIRSPRPTLPPSSRPRAETRSETWFV